MDLKQYLKLSQQLVMTPQLQQAIKLLQLSRAELAEVVEEQLLENPVLEELPRTDSDQSGQDGQDGQDGGNGQDRGSSAQEIGGDAAPENDRAAERNDPMDNWEQFVENYDQFSNSTYAPSYRLNNEEMPSLEATLTKASTLWDHLRWQLQLSAFDEEDMAIAHEIIGNINDDGYFTGSTTEEIAEDAGVPAEQVEWVLERIQEFDPIGVGARDLRECLLIQAEHYHPDNTVIHAVIERHLGTLERRDYNAVIRDLKIDMEELGVAMRVIASLEPKPGRGFSTDEDTHYITPDVYVYKVGDEYVTVLNEDGLPKLKISPMYKAALHAGTGGAATKDFIQEKFRSAVWLIRSIHQRQDTIRKVTESIVRFQTEFLDRGVEHLKPLILRDVADDIGMHESTVSRVTTNKYVHTPQGIFELKYFFNSRINTVDGGEDRASEAVKQMIKKLVSEENPKQPYSDARIVELLAEQNVEIARRTVAKYREMLGIDSSSRRRKYF
ncbi:MAG: RNA polymerase sigma-54 factor [Myxococcales bacterium]